jgi:hypothetical protein
MPGNIRNASVPFIAVETALVGQLALSTKPIPLSSPELLNEQPLQLALGLLQEWL